MALNQATENVREFVFQIEETLAARRLYHSGSEPWLEANAKLLEKCRAAASAETFTIEFTATDLFFEIPQPVLALRKRAAAGEIHPMAARTKATRPRSRRTGVQPWRSSARIRPRSRESRYRDAHAVIADLTAMRAAG